MFKQFLLKGQCTLWVIVLSLFSQSSSAQEATEKPLILLIHPTYTPEQSVAVHQPLADYIAKQLGKKVQLITPRDFHKYWQDTRSGGHYDLALEDSHIADYRRMQGTHEPLVHAVDDVRYLVLSSDPLVRQPEHLIGLRISTMSSPSLGFQMLTRWFNNPMAQPQILSNSKSWLDSVEMVFAAESDATIAPDWLGERYPNLTPVLRSDPMPGITLSVSRDLPVETRQKLLEAMLALDESNSEYGVLNELNVRRFVAADISEYEGLAGLLNSLYSVSSH